MRGMKRKRLARIVVLLVALTLVAAACSGDNTGNEEPDATTQDTTATTDGATTGTEGATGDGESGFMVDTIEVMSRWTPDEARGAAFLEVAAAFTEETGVKVEIIGTGEEDLDVAYETALLGGTEPHLVLINLFDRTTSWLENGATIDVAPYIDAWGLRESVSAEAIGEWATESGSVQGFPYQGFAWPFWFNTSMLADAGVDAVPTTTDELIAAADALRANGAQPVVVGGSDWSGQKMFMQIAQLYSGPDVIRDLLQNGGFCANPEAMQGIELFNDLLNAGVFIDDVEGFTADLMNETFYSEGAAMMPAGSWAFENTPEALLPNVQLGGFPIPSGSAYDLPVVYQGFTGVGFMISHRGEEEAIDALEALITSLYAEENYSKFVPANIVPAITLSDPSVATNPLFSYSIGAEYAGATDVALLMDVWVPGPSNDGVNQAIAGAFAGVSPADTCAALDSAY